MIDLSERRPFPRVIDNSMRTLFVSCPWKFYLRYICHLALREESVHLHAGGCFATGVETVRRAVYSDGLDVDSALTRGIRAMAKSWGDFESSDPQKTFYRCCTALEYYFTVAFPPAIDTIQPMRDTSGKPAIEWSFCLPIDVKHPETGEPLLYCGRFDMFGVMGERMLCIVDEKTTKQLGGQWAGKWRLRSQFTGYTWGARQYGHDVRACVIRGLSFLKNDHDSLQAIVYRPQWHVDMWYEQLLRDVKRMITQWEKNQWDRALSDPCGDFGGCQFLEVCDTNQPNQWASNYVIAPWDPLRRIELRQDV